jgi:glycosyltransferase involved in cell wall biosynthesis
MKLSIVIPAYNEENRILPTLRDYHSFFKNKLQNDFEIIVIPNNCSDSTEQVVRNFAENKKQIKVFNIPFYVGKGGAVMKGFGLAKGDFIGFSDADNSTNPENFYKLYENKQNYAGIIGSRKIKGAIIFPKRKLNQNLSSFLFNKITRLLFNLKYKDTQCGAKLFRENVARLLVESYSEKGWIFDVDLLNLCKKNNSKILEYPINWKDSTGSKLSIKDGIFSIIDLFGYRLRNLKNGL